MTLQSRRKRPITAQNSRRRETSAKARACIAALRLALLSGCTLWTSVAVAQQPAWQPTRVPANVDAKPLSEVPSHASLPQSSEPATGIALRWRSVSRDLVPDSSSASTSSYNSQVHVAQASANAANSQRNQPVAAPSAWASNPLRDNQVRSANYQTQESAPNTFSDPFGDGQPPALPPANLPSLPPSQQLNPPKTLPGRAEDPLSKFELPPVPGEATDNQTPARSDENAQEPSPFDKRTSPKLEAGQPRSKTGEVDPEDERSDLEIPNRNRNANTISCNELRDRPFTKRLAEINLDVSPSYGEGLQARRTDSGKRRLDFAASAPVREWTDYAGINVAFGRLVDLRNDLVVLDVSGTERTIPLRDLSDIDVAYVAQAWNLPSKCGVGYESYAGRNFIASAAEWKASGLCHKPLYFEEVQLERYGHEVGPVLQPLISSAHFFTNILILPYKMGIHPPGECQYALGYYRPGDCAPYMIQPFPLSLRGAAVQAGFVTGAAALIP